MVVAATGRNEPMLTGYGSQPFARWLVILPIIGFDTRQAIIPELRQQALVVASGQGVRQNRHSMRLVDDGNDLSRRDMLTGDERWLAGSEVAIERFPNGIDVPMGDHRPRDVGPADRTGA